MIIYDTYLTYILTYIPALTLTFILTEISVKYNVDNTVNLKNFENLKHIADGSNANVFSAFWNNAPIIIKMVCMYVCVCLCMYV